MKNRKLFAILTLVAFMMTLLPMAAFAGTAGVFDGANRFSTVVTTDKTSLAADGSATAKFTVYVYDEDNDVAGAGTSVYMTSKRANTDVFLNASTGAALTAVSGGGAGNTQDYIYHVTTDASGKAEFKVRSSIVGTADIAIGLLNPGAATDLYDYVTNGVANLTADTVGHVATKAITFTAPSLNAVNVIGTPIASDGTPVAGAGTSGSPYASGSVNGNGVDYYEVSFKVVGGNGAPVADQEVTFSTNKTEATLSKTTATTDVTGVVKVKVYASKPGDYKVKAAAGDKDKEIYLTYANNDLYSVELVSGGNETIAKDADYSLKFKFYDINGNQIKLPALANLTATTVANSTINLAAGQLGLKVEAISRPSDAAMDEKIYNNGAVGDYVFASTTEGYLKMTIKGGELDTEGNYELKVYFDNGKFVNVPFTVKKQGTPTSLTLKYDQTTVPINSVAVTTSAATVKRLDAAGVAKELTSAQVQSDVVFTVSDPRIVTNVTNTGVLTFTTDEKYAGTVVVTAVDKSKNLTASFTIEANKTAAGLGLTAPEAVTAVGKDAVIKAQVLDVDGKAVALGAGVTGVSVDYYVISKPAGAIVSTSNPSTLLDDIKKTGAADLKISSNVKGDVKVQVVLTSTGVPAVTLTKDVTVKFADVAAPVAYGAKNVTMFIGSVGYVQDGAAKTMDQAAFIQDGRTFVPVRMVGEALGAEVEFDAATQVITLTRPDVTITMTVGSNVLTKSDGTTVVADVAPFIVAETGRTVIPFRAIAEAFGATVEAVFAADGTVNAVTFQQ